MPIILILLLLLGLQYQVGTDYESYLNMVVKSAGLAKVVRNKEYMFVALVQFSRFLRVPQAIFVLSGMIQLLFFTLIIFEIKKLNYKLSVFFFLYFTLSLTFFNQFNGIRQYIAVYIFVYAFLKLLDNKHMTFILLIVFASLFHSSAIFLLILIIIKFLFNRKINTSVIVIALVLLFILSMFDLSSVVKWVLAFTPYKSYSVSSYFKRTSFEGIITKIPKILITIIAIVRINNDPLSTKERQLLNMAFLTSGILILSFASSVIWRFYQYFDLFIIFPTLFYFSKSRDKDLKLVLIFVLILMLLVKILVIPSGEYFYQSILFY